MLRLSLESEHIKILGTLCIISIVYNFFLHTATLTPGTWAETLIAGDSSIVVLIRACVMHWFDDKRRHCTVANKDNNKLYWLRQLKINYTLH